MATQEQLILEKCGIDKSALFSEVMDLIPKDQVKSQEFLNDYIGQAAANDFDGWLLMLKSFVHGLQASGNTSICELSCKPELVCRFLLSDALLSSGMFTKN